MSCIRFFAVFAPWIAGLAMPVSPAATAGGVLADAAQLDAVTVSSTRLFQRVDSATQGTVYAEQFQYRPLTRPAELMEVMPGLIVTQHSGEGKANQYFLRGFNLDHGTDFATTLDDMPVNLRTHAHGQGYTDLNFLIPELVERIDYRKGPYYAQYGDFSAAGAADLRYRQQLDQDFVEATGGGYGYGRLVAAGSQAAYGGHWLYGVEGLHYDGPFDNGDNLNKGSGLLRWSRQREDEELHVELMAYRARWRSTDQIPTRAVTQGLIDDFGCIDCSDAGSSDRYSLSGGWSRRLGEGRIAASLYAVRYRLQLYSDFTYFLNADNIASLPGKAFEPNPALPTDQFEQLDRRWIGGGQLRYTRPQTLFGIDGDSELGLQTRYDAIEPVGLYDTQQRQRYYTVSEDRVGEWSGALYAQQRLQPTRWSQLTLGLRHDQYHFDVNASTPANSGARSAGITAPKLALTLGPFANTAFYVNLGKGFHSNDARGVVQTVNPASAASPTTSPAERATPLAAARSVDLGLRTALLPHTQLALSLFRLDLDSELTLAGDDGTTGIGGATRRQGVETALFWRPWQALVVDVDYAWTQARYRGVDDSVSHVEEAPTGVAALGISYEAERGFDGALRLRWFGPRTLTEDGSVRSRATTLVNASLGYRFDAHWRLSLQATNLLNSRDHDIDYFYTSRLQGEPAEGVDDAHFHPVEPFNLRMVLRYGG